MLLCLSEEAADAAAARTIASRVGYGAFRAEFRIIESVAEGRSSARRSPVYADLMALSDWNGESLPRDAPSAWRDELKAQERSLRHSEDIRGCLLAAVASGALSAADSADLILRFDLAVARSPDRCAYGYD